MVLTSTKSVPALPEGAHQEANSSSEQVGQLNRYRAPETGSNNFRPLRDSRGLDPSNGRREMLPASRGSFERWDLESQHLSSSHIESHRTTSIPSSNHLPTRSGPTKSSSSLAKVAATAADHGSGPLPPGVDYNPLIEKAQERAPRTWEGSVFNEKWLLQPAEVWSSEARRRSSQSDMSPKHRHTAIVDLSAGKIRRSRNDSIVSNPFATADQPNSNDLQEQEVDTASVTGSTISTQVSSIFDHTPIPHNQRQAQQGHHPQGPDRSSQSAFHFQPHADVHELQGSAFHYQLGQVQAADSGQTMRLGPLKYQSQVAQVCNTGPSTAPGYLQQMSHTIPANYYGAPYTDSRIMPSAIHSPSLYGLPVPQGHSSPIDPQYSRPTLPPSSRRQATMANYERMKAEQLVAQNAAMAFSNMQMHYALGGLHLPGSSQHLVGSAQYGAFQHAGEVQSGYPLASLAAAAIHAPTSVPVNRLQVNSHFRSDPSNLANLVPNAYHQGSDLMCPRANSRLSERYQQLLRNGTPSLTEAFSNDNIPFTTSTATHQGTSYGVVRLGNVSKNDPHSR